MDIKSKKVVFECPIFKIEERQVKVKTGKTKNFYVMVRPPNVSVIALTKDKKIILIKEILKGKECLLLPGGKVETYTYTDEDVEQQALAELHEEAGFTTSHIELLEKTSSPWNTLDREFYKYLAWDCTSVGQKLEDGEFITPYLVSVKKAQSIIQRRQMTSPEEERALEKAIHLFKSKKLL